MLDTYIKRLKSLVFTSKILDIMLPLFYTSILGYLVNIITNSQSSGKDLMGYLNDKQLKSVFFLFVAIFFIFLFFDLLRRHLIRGEYEGEIDKMKQEVQDQCTKEQKAILKKIKKPLISIFPKLCELVVRGIAYPERSASLNAYIYNVESENGRDRIKIMQDELYEGDSIIGHSLLDYIDPYEHPYLIISEAFINDSKCCSPITEEMKAKYKGKIKDKIDPDIKWVYAIPFSVEHDNKPDGLICFNSKTVFTQSQDEESALCRILEQFIKIVKELKKLESELDKHLYKV